MYAGCFMYTKRLRFAGKVHSVHQYTFPARPSYIRNNTKQNKEHYNSVCTI